MDQAFIKAYAKDAPPAAAVTGASAAGFVPAGRPARGPRLAPIAAAIPATATVQPGPRSGMAPQVIEQIYHDGSLYRIELPTTIAPRKKAIPAPHFELPPRTSPRRNIRRSMLKLMGRQASAIAAIPVEPQPRRASGMRQQPGAGPLSTVAGDRDSKLTLPAQQTEPAHRRQTQTLAQIARQLAPPSIPPVPAAPADTAPRQELAPEVVIDDPRSTQPLPIKAAPILEPHLPPAPSFAPRPSAAPLNLASEFGPQFEVHGHWEGAEAAGPAAMVVLPEPADLHITEPTPLIELKLDALPLPAEPKVRLDPPHAAALAKPHFALPPPTDSSTAESVPALQPAPTQQEPAADGLPAAQQATPPATSYFGTAQEDNEDTGDDALATKHLPHPGDELEFADAEAAPAEAVDGATSEMSNSPPAANRSSPAPHPTPDDCVPVWEVDRIQWPVAVERLVSDKDGYFAQASSRLLAAVRDGLRTLAISGNRRGEGRTTLALSLARAAAKAGIQVAVIDADFARPQLAARIGLEVNHGWQDAAMGLVPLSETAVRSLAENVTILPLEGSAARAGLSLADPRVTATLRAAAATFELVIVDLGPLPAEEEIFPEGEACPLDAAIVVRDLRYASAAESEAVGRRLMSAGVEAVGIAENFVIDEEIPVTSV